MSDCDELPVGSVLSAQGPLPRSGSCFLLGVQSRTRVYVDGFNLYYGAVKGTTFKWLDPVHLSGLLLPPGYTIDKLLYFTARVSGISDPALRPAGRPT